MLYYQLTGLLVIRYGYPRLAENTILFSIDYQPSCEMTAMNRKNLSGKTLSQTFLIILLVLTACTNTHRSDDPQGTGAPSSGRQLHRSVQQSGGVATEAGRRTRSPYALGRVRVCDRTQVGAGEGSRTLTGLSPAGF